MAAMHMLGVPEEIRRLNLLAEGARPTAERLLVEGAEIAARATQTAAAGHGLRRTGQLIASIGHGGPQMDSDGGRIEVYPKGQRAGSKKTKTRNALVGFVQEYGRRYGRRARPGTGFFAEGREASAAEVQERWAAGWSEYLEQRG